METESLSSRSRSRSRSLEMENEPLHPSSSDTKTEPLHPSSSDTKTEPLPFEPPLPWEIERPHLPEMLPGPLPSPSSGRKPSRLTYCVAVWPSTLTNYTISIMTTYLTGVWNLTITHAAALINLYSGIESIIPAITTRIADCFRGSYFMLWLSRFAFICGFGLLTMSTPPVLAVVTSRCSSFVPQCIGMVHKNLFYTALLLLAIGLSTHKSSLPQFEEDQFQFTTKKHYKPCSWQRFSYAMLAYVVPVVAVCAIGFSKSWLIKFGIGAISTVVSTLIFSIGLYSYKPPSGRWSYLTGIFTGRDIDTVMGPICMVFVLLGVVSSLGSTFFMEQATDMNHYIGRRKVPDLILPASRHLVKWSLKMLLEKYSPWTARFTLPGIIVSSMISILCCITAAKVETRRLDTVKSHGFIDKPEEKIPMTIFWLLPQFLLLGLAEQIGTDSIVNLFYFPLHSECLFSEERRSRRIYMETLANALRGVGYIGGMLSVYAVGKVKPSWFQYTLNRSRLDNYYWTLAALSAANLVSSLLFFLLIHLWRLFCAPHKRIPPLSEMPENSKKK